MIDLKSHENARQFKCTECTKTFNRADLLSRHRAKHSGSTGTISINKRADRAAIACVSCISAKVKCQDNKPCMRCTNKRISCEVPSSDSHGHPFKANTNSASRRVTQLRSVTLEPEAAPPDLARYIDDQGAEDSNDHRMNSERSTTDKDLVLYSHHPAFPNIYAPQDNFTTFADESLNTFPFYSATGNFDQNIPFIPGGFSHDLDINFWDVDFSTVELAHQDTLRGVEEQAQAQPGQNEESWVRRDASKRHAAFERSPWLFTPTPNDHALNDQANLTVDENSIPAALSPSDEISHSDHIHCCIDSNTRDKILSLLLSMRRDINQVRTFPSLDLINNIIRIFFTQELLRTHCLIHTGTFYSSKSLPQLLLAIIALGASYISVPSIWKMGVALQEVVRHTVSDLVFPPHLICINKS